MSVQDHPWRLPRAPKLRPMLLRLPSAVSSARMRRRPGISFPTRAAPLSTSRRRGATRSFPRPPRFRRTDRPPCFRAMRSSSMPFKLKVSPSPGGSVKLSWCAVSWLAGCWRNGSATPMSSVQQRPCGSRRLCLPRLRPRPRGEKLVRLPRRNRSTPNWPRRSRKTKSFCCCYNLPRCCRRAP